MSDDEVINYAKTHIDKSENHGKPSHSCPVAYKNKSGINDKNYQAAFDEGEYMYRLCKRRIEHLMYRLI